MNGHFRLKLHPNHPMRLDDSSGSELLVESGIVWITDGCVAADLFLAVGDRYRIPRKGRTLAEALREGAVVHLEAK